jgi:hypothetical protein
MKEKSKHKSKSKSSSLKRSLHILMGGEENIGAGEGKSESTKSKSLFSFLDRFKTEKPEIPKDYKASNGADMDADADADKGITFKSNKLLSVLSPSEAASVASSSGDSESSPASSTWWFVFRVIIVFVIVIVFALNLTGYLEHSVEWFKQQIELYITPLLVSVGIVKATPSIVSRDALPGKDSNTGTNTMNQLEQNVGTNPVTTTPPTTTSPTASTPSASMPTMPRTDPSLKPIPIQPNQRKTPLQNQGESARPPSSAPASYQEETSREKEKEESVKKALEYALKNQIPAADDATSNTQIQTSKSGYCYIGEDRGFRSCIEVSQDMKCMSGDIFPTMDVCVNPRLRV